MTIILNKTDRFITLNHNQGKPVGDDPSSLRANSVKIVLTPRACTEVEDSLYEDMKKNESLFSFIQSMIDQDWIEIDQSSSPDRAIKKMETLIQRKEGNQPNQHNQHDETHNDGHDETHDKNARRGRPPKNDPEIVL